MPRKPISMDVFIEHVLVETFATCDRELAPANQDLRTQNISSLEKQLRDRVPKRFLASLETTKNPKRSVTEAFEAFQSAPQPCRFMTVPGISLREGILGGVPPYVVNCIIEEVFGPVTAPMNQLGVPEPQQMKFTKDIAMLYAFYQKKVEQASLESEPETMKPDDPSSADNGDVEIRITLRDDEENLLLESFSDSLFSIHLFIKKLKKGLEIKTGQYA